MKTITKILMAAAVLCFTFSADAQWWNAGNNPYDGSNGNPIMEYAIPFLTITSTGTGNNGVVMRKNGGTGAGWLYTDSQNKVRLDASTGGGSSQFVLLPSGNIGLGTATPDEELDLVDGDMSMDEGHYIKWKNGTTEVARMGYTGATQWMRSTEAGSGIELDGETVIRFDINGTTRANIQPGGMALGLSSTAASDLLHLGAGNMRMTDGNDIRWYNGASLVGQLRHFANGFELEFNEAGDDIRLDADDEIILETDNQNRMTIVENGRIGIGTGNPLSDVHIADAGEVAGLIIERTDQNNYVNLLSGTTGNSFYFARAKRFSIVPSSSITSTTPSINNSIFMYGQSWPTAAQRGNTGFGRENPVHKVDVNGNVRCNTVIETSDRRLKRDINEYDKGLEAVRQINPVTYRYNERSGMESDELQTGIVAQELQEIAPELVQEFTNVTYTHDEEGEPVYAGEEIFLEVRTSEVKWMMLNAIKELADDNDELKTQNAELQEKYDALEDRMAAIEAMLKKSNTNVTNVIESVDQTNVTLEGNGDVAALAQNQPNPFNENTVINYFLPENATGAHMNIFSTEGKVIKTIKLNEIGEGQVNLRANGLAAGNYMYQLVTDAGVVGTKTMVLTK